MVCWYYFGGCFVLLTWKNPALAGFFFSCVLL
jgi:hypothetical protein